MQFGVFQRIPKKCKGNDMEHYILFQFFTFDFICDCVVYTFYLFTKKSSRTKNK